MEVKLGKIINSKDALNELYSELSKTKVKAKIAWRFLSLIKIIEEQFKRFDELKNDLIKKYGEEKDGNIVVEKDTDNFKEFIKELNEVGEEIVNIDVQKISIDDIAEVEIEMSKIILLDWFICE